MPQKNNYYAYRLPNGKSGVVGSWPACEKIVSGVHGARYRGFPARHEAEAWLHAGAAYEPNLKQSMNREPGIYFDAGTGRGNGVEINVTDERGKSLLHKTLAAKLVSKFGTHRVADRTATNNYGELLAMKHALMIAQKIDAKKIFGDSKLVIEYWSQWRMKRNTLPEETVDLAGEVAELRENFESRGGEVVRIGGGQNPADLGFHR
jgi:ribonuclease HI